jgi:hypothetical protein
LALGALSLGHDRNRYGEKTMTTLTAELTAIGAELATLTDLDDDAVFSRRADLIHRALGAVVRHCGGVMATVQAVRNASSGRARFEAVPAASVGHCMIAAATHPRPVEQAIWLLLGTYCHVDQMIGAIHAAE